MRLDLKDKKLLFELSKNSRLPYTKLGRLTRMSKQVVEYRIKRLQEAGIILGYLTELNFSAYGQPIVGRVYMQLHKLGSRREQRITAHLHNFEEWSFYERLDGRYDLNIAIMASTLQEFQRKADMITKAFRSEIREEHIVIRYQAYQYDFKVLLNSKQSGESAIVDERPPVALDELDEAILKQLVNNARMETTEIAHRLDKPYATVHGRIQRLISKEVIKRFTVALDWEKMGYLTTRFLINFVHVENHEEFRHFCRNHPNITYLVFALGAWNAEIYTCFPSVKAYRAFRAELRNKFGKHIRNIEMVDALSAHPAQEFS